MGKSAGQSTIQVVSTLAHHGCLNGQIYLRLEKSVYHCFYTIYSLSGVFGLNGVVSGWN